MKINSGSDQVGFKAVLVEVEADDYRQSVLQTILTENGLGSEHIVLVLPDKNKAFTKPVDFDGLKGTQNAIQARIVFIAKGKLSRWAIAKGFLVYPSLDEYIQMNKREQTAPLVHTTAPYIPHVSSTQPYDRFIVPSNGDESLALYEKLNRMVSSFITAEEYKHMTDEMIGRNWQPGETRALLELLEVVHTVRPDIVRFNNKGASMHHDPKGSQEENLPELEFEVPQRQIEEPVIRTRQRAVTPTEHLPLETVVPAERWWQRKDVPNWVVLGIVVFILIVLYILFNLHLAGVI